MVLVAIGVRIALIVATQSYRLTWEWHSWEMSEIGNSLYLGHGFASPWGGSTGPTAWTAPLYPWLVALMLHIFGGRTPAAAFALFTFNSIFSALTCWTIYRIANCVFNRKAAVWSGWIWAFLPYAIYWSVKWIWETTLSTFLLTLLFLLTLEMEGENRLWPWLRYGALWGILALTNTSTLIFLPFAGCWCAYRLHREGKSFLLPVVLSAAVFWAVITPWIARNYVVFHKLIFIRGDVGSELRTGNNPQADGTWVPIYRAGNNESLLAQYKQMGEVAYDAEQAELAKRWISEHPRQFLWLCGWRIYRYWTGLPERGMRVFEPAYLALTLLGLLGMVLAIRRRIHGVFLFASLLAFYPVIYYLVFPTDRYRHPIEPELLILAVWFVMGGRTRTDLQTDEAAST